jgi:hypothetical protein
MPTGATAATIKKQKQTFSFYRFSTSINEKKLKKTILFFFFLQVDSSLSSSHRHMNQSTHNLKKQNNPTRDEAKLR